MDAKLLSKLARVQLRNACFTLIPYDDGQYETLLAMASDKDGFISYLVVGKEICPTTETPHLQGYMEFRSRQDLVRLLAFLPFNYCRARRGTQDQAINYCKKDEDFVEVGLPKVQGLRNDLRAARAVTCKKRTWRDVVTDVNLDVPRAKFGKWLRETWDYCHEEEEDPVLTGWKIPLITDFKKSVVLIGASSIGKSEYARACLPNAVVASHIDDLKNVDLSMGIIFDDMDFTQWPRSAQIHVLCNRTKRTIHARYNNITIPKGTPKIFTCNAFPFLQQDRAIDARLNVIEVKKGMLIDLD